MKENIVLKWSLILSIVIVANLFFNYTLSLVFDAPTYEQYCYSQEKPSMPIQDRAMCEQGGGRWEPAPRPGTTSYEDPSGFCDMFAKCQKSYEDANKAYEQKAFIALVVIGVVILAASLFVKSNLVLSSALSLTAVLDFIIASMGYWRYADELLKVVILFFALATLIYLVLKKFKDKI